MPQLARDALGAITDGGRKVVLRGGHYDLFVASGRSARGLANPTTLAFLPIGPDNLPDGIPCPGEKCPVNAGDALPRRKARLLTWPAAASTGADPTWDVFFTFLRKRGLNLLRVWVTGGTSVARVDGVLKPMHLHPFNPVLQGGGWKWKVRAAVEQGQWNNAYFDRLARFAQKADENGVSLQLTLFNYFDFSRDETAGFKAWCMSPWNPKLSDAGDTWSNAHLVNTGAAFLCDQKDVQGDANRRLAYFYNPANLGLEKVQRALIRKLGQTLGGRKNIILEIFNEPRGSDAEIAGFSSRVIDMIAQEAPGWKPLISVNASSGTAGDEPLFDVDWWRSHSNATVLPYVPNYDKIDLISYHGLTGYPSYSGVAGCRVLLGKVPPVDPGRIERRITRHRAVHRWAGRHVPIIFSTDAALTPLLNQCYTNFDQPTQVVDMSVRDGQIQTDLTNAAGSAPDVDNDPDTDPNTPAGWVAVRSDLENWVFWTLSRGKGDRLGLLHFQNHSSFQQAFARIYAGYLDAVEPTTARIPAELDEVPEPEPA
jgi:hypothetical protein